MLLAVVVSLGSMALRPRTIQVGEVRYEGKARTSTVDEA